VKIVMVEKKVKKQKLEDHEVEGNKDIAKG
jgi:hypothetical protein